MNTSGNYENVSFKNKRDSSRLKSAKCYIIYIYNTYIISIINMTNVIYI